MTHQDISKEVHEAVRRQDSQSMERAIRQMNDAYKEHGQNYDHYKTHDLKAINNRFEQAGLLPRVDITSREGQVSYTHNETLRVVGTSTDKTGLVVAGGGQPGRSQARYIMDKDGLFHEAQRDGTGYKAKPGGKTYYRDGNGQLHEAPKATLR